MNDSEYRKLLAQQNWAEIYPELVLYACEQAVSGKTWTGTTRQFKMKEDKLQTDGAAPRDNVHTEPMLADGKTPKDIVQDVLLETMKGEKKWRWDPARNSDIRVHLKYRIWSRISTLIEKEDNIKRVRVPQDDKGNDRYDLIDKDGTKAKAEPTTELAEDAVRLEEPSAPEQADLDPSQFEAFLDRRLREDSDLRSLDERIRKAFNGDTELEIVYDYMANECPPRRIAEELGIPVADVNNLKKKLYRRLEEEFPEEFR